MQTGVVGGRPELVGDHIGQIMLDPCSIQLSLERARVLVAVPIIVAHGEAQTKVDWETRAGDLRLLWSVIGKAITDFEVLHRAVLVRFEGDFSLRTEPEDVPYENGTIDYLQPGRFEVF